jgi:hypothetical protein
MSLQIPFLFLSAPAPTPFAGARVRTERVSPSAVTALLCRERLIAPSVPGGRGAHWIVPRCHGRAARFVRSSAGMQGSACEGRCRYLKRTQ